MTGSRCRRRRQLERQKQRQRQRDCTHVNFVRRLSQDLLAKIHSRLTFLDYLAFAVVCRDAGHPLQLDARSTTPWIVLPGETTADAATFFSLADARAASARTSARGIRGHVVVGSSSGWLATADEHGVLRICNPFTGEQAKLPDVTTIPFLHARFNAYGHSHVDIYAEPLLRIRYGGLVPPLGTLPRAWTLTMRQIRPRFYHKVVLSASPDPNSYAAMPILEKDFGVPAFATAADPSWKVAPSRDGVEDAVHHDGRFYSVLYAGAVEAWERDAATGEFTSTPLAPVHITEVVNHLCLHRKYIAAAPDGRLVVVLKYTRKEENPIYCRHETNWSCVFKVLVLDAARRRWMQGHDVIGDAVHPFLRCTVISESVFESVADTT